MQVDQLNKPGGNPFYLQGIGFSVERLTFRIGQVDFQIVTTIKNCVDIGFHTGQVAR